SATLAAAHLSLAMFFSPCASVSLVGIPNPSENTTSNWTPVNFLEISLTQTLRNSTCATSFAAASKWCGAESGESWRVKRMAPEVVSMARDEVGGRKPMAR
ncbi:hypothetical protein BCR44DRAFT_1430415, partial [Catenaria anguillulae PL171]